MSARSTHSGAPNEVGSVDRALGAIMQYCQDVCPEVVDRWAAEVRLTMRGPEQRVEAVFEPWRSRDVRWVKAFKNGKQEDCYRDKQGNVYPAEGFRRQFERLEDSRKEGDKE